MELSCDLDNASLYASAVPEGYRFTEWTSAAGQASTAAKYNLVPGNAYELTANFVKIKTGKTVHASYFLNGGTGNVPVDNNRYRSGDEVTLMSGEGLTKLGMVFMGWALEDGTVVGNTHTLQNSDMIFYAVWAQVPEIPDPPKTGDAAAPAGFALLTLAGIVGFFYIWKRGATDDTVILKPSKTLPVTGRILRIK